MGDDGFCATSGGVDRYITKQFREKGPKSKIHASFLTTAQDVASSMHAECGATPTEGCIDATMKSNAQQVVDTVTHLGTIGGNAGKRPEVVAATMLQGCLQGGVSGQTLLDSLGDSAITVDGNVCSAASSLLTQDEQGNPDVNGVCAHFRGAFQDATKGATTYDTMFE